MHKNISLIRMYKNTFKYYPVPSILTFQIYVCVFFHSLVDLFISPSPVCKYLVWREVIHSMFEYQNSLLIMFILLHSVNSFKVVW